MKKRLILSFIPVPILALVAWMYRPVLFPRTAGLPPRAEMLAADVSATRLLLDQSLDWRARARRYLDQVGPRLRDGVLTSGDLDALYHGAEDYVFLSRRWQALIDVQGEEAWARAEPQLASDPLVRMQTKLLLAAALMQHDDYALGVEPYYGAAKLRRLLRVDHAALDGEMSSAVKRFLDPATRLRLAQAVVWHRAEGVRATDRSPDEAFLDEVIVQSPGYQFFTQKLPARVVAEWATGSRVAVGFVTDLISTVGTAAVGTASKTVGNAVGLVETRHGYLFDLPPDRREALRARLRPLDVLLEKTPFRLTDRSIPGHYGHVAIWVGGEAELAALGVWDDPLVRPHHDRLRSGATIIEALRTGVEINPLQQFLNIDDLLVIRPAALAPAETRAALLRAFAQVGKEYDFNFDVESDRRIVCSELAYVVFPAVSWPTKATLGRSTISPDNVAAKAQPGGPFTPVILFHDGIEISGDLAPRLEALLEGGGPRFQAAFPGFVGRSASP